MDRGRNIDALFESTKKEFGFASLVRCTVTYAKLGSDKFVGSGGGITAHTIELNPPFVKVCADRHLNQFPASVRLIVMLGAAVKVVNSMREMLGGEPTNKKAERSYAYLCRGKPVVHVPHPSSRGNNGGEEHRQVQDAQV